MDNAGEIGIAIQDGSEKYSVHKKIDPKDQHYISLEEINEIIESEYIFSIEIKGYKNTFFYDADSVESDIEYLINDRKEKNKEN